MGGAAPAVDANGDLWIATGNGSVSSNNHAYDGSGGVLEISPSLRLLQFFTPANWRVNNSDDLDMTTEPVLLPDGQVITTSVDGGSADPGMTVYLPCLSGIIA